MAKSKKVATPKSVTFSVRLDPRDRFAAELASRADRRTVTNFIEWAVHKALRDVTVQDYKKPVLSIAEEVWMPDMADRVMRLAFFYPHLLSAEEKVIHKAVLAHPVFWSKNSDRSYSSLKHGMVRKLWDTLELIGEGRYDMSAIDKEIENIREE